MPAVCVLCDAFPELSETFIVLQVAGLRAAGLDVRVEAIGPAARPAANDEPADFISDDTTAGRLVALARLVARHPFRCAVDLISRRRWRLQEPVLPLRALAPAARRILEHGEVHMHAHFAAGAALAALRLARLLDVPYSVTAHGYDIYARPANLEEKLYEAAFATSGSAYTVARLRSVAPGAEVHEIVMGVDGDVFARSQPPPGGRTVAAVGRLVEKKGLIDLVQATALLRDRGRPLDAVRIVGDGPLRDTLAAAIERLGVGDTVELLGARDQPEVRKVLERADVFCLPCVVAADGDRDAMPVAVKEALAMELPVVATSAVGLPEIVRPEFGTLVASRDPVALADALDAELARTPEQRAERGRAGRAYVLRRADARREAAKLAALMRASGV